MKYKCIKDNEWGKTSELLGITQTLKEWKAWAVRDRYLLRDKENYEWFLSISLSQIKEKIEWFYNIELKAIIRKEN